MSSIFQLELNHVIIPRVEWDMPWEEVLGGTGRATLSVQDRDNTLDPQPHWDVKVSIISGPFAGHVLFRGEVIPPEGNLPLRKDFNTWKLDCADYNDQLPQRLVGAPDGRTWIEEPVGLGFYINIDPFAVTFETDKITIQNWLDHYIRVDGEAIGTDTFVGEYMLRVPPLPLDYTNLQRACELLAALIVNNLQFWIDPDLEFHWVIIPPWQDVAQDLTVVEGDETESQLPSMFPEGSPTDVALLGTAPADIVGTEVLIGDELPEGEIGLVSLQWRMDGTNMPEQLYVRGATGYVYNAPPIPAPETKTIVTEPIPGEAQYKLTFLATTKLWHTDGTGYISVSYDTVGASGPYLVEWTYVAWNEARHKGGHFWRLLEGPDAGKLVDNDTNILTGYGQILVEAVTPAGLPGDPQVGIGGSGYVGEAIQDPNKRQAYLNAGISVDRATRDAFGGQVLYRGSFPTLRGNVTIKTTIHGWRVGQLVKISDPRWVASLNDRYYIIQRVAGKPLPDTEYVEYSIGFGDGPVSRYSAQPPQGGGGSVPWPNPANQIVVKPRDLIPGPNSTQIIEAQLVNNLGEPWHIQGKSVQWRLEVYNNLGVLQVGVGSLTPTLSVTDKYGIARTTLMTGAGTNLVYYVFADVVAN